MLTRKALTFSFALSAMIGALMCSAVHADELNPVKDFIERTLPVFNGLKWQRIEGRRFMMGSNYAADVACKDGQPPDSIEIDETDVVEYCTLHGNADWFLDEAPMTETEVANYYWMSDTEITVSRFRKFVQETGYLTVAERTKRSLGEATQPGEISTYGVTSANWKKPWGGKDAVDDHPVVHVAWEDAVAFTDWLSAKSGLVIRLPTEAEWEFAATGKHNFDGKPQSIYSWGVGKPGGANGKVANFSDRKFGEAYPMWKYPVDGSHDDGFARLAPVRSYKPNSFGLFDISGNVWEWTANVYRSRAYEEPERRANIDGNQSQGFHHTMRGGSFDFELPFHRVHTRRSLGFVRRNFNVLSSISVGFRIVSDGSI